MHGGPAFAQLPAISRPLFQPSAGFFESRDLSATGVPQPNCTLGGEYEIPRSLRKHDARHRALDSNRSRATDQRRGCLRFAIGISGSKHALPERYWENGKVDVRLLRQLLRPNPERGSVRPLFSADIDYPRKLEAAGLAEPGTLYPYATGKIVLWVANESKLDLSAGLKVLLDPSVKKIAIANPAHAP